MPSPLLADDDPVLEQVLRLAGLSVSSASTTDPQELSCGEGLTLADAKVACYMAREETLDEQAVLDKGMVRSDEDGWAVDTTIHESPDGPTLPIDEALSQAVFGFWTLVDTTDTLEARAVYLHGFSYDTYASAATLLEMLAHKMTLQFDFSDGSGSYPRSQKFNNAKRAAADLWKKARVRVVAMSRNDTQGGTFWQEVEDEFMEQGWWGWAP